MQNEDVTRSLRVMEELKVQLLKNAVELCDVLLNSADEDFFVNMSDKTTDMLISTYLLANVAGVPYSVTENNLRKKLKLYLLETRDSDILSVYISSLAKYAFG